MITHDDDTVVIAPAPGDVQAVLAERAALAYAGRRTMTMTGGFGLAALRAAAAEQDHEPFPLVRRRVAP